MNFELLIYSIVTVYHVVLQSSMCGLNDCHCFFHRRFADNHGDKNCCFLLYQIQCRGIENQRQSPASQKQEQCGVIERMKLHSALCFKTSKGSRSINN